MKRNSIRTTLFFSLMAFSVLVGTMLLNLLFIGILLHTGHFNARPPWLILFAIAFASVTMGLIFSRFAAHRPIGTILEISRATQEIAKGNFDITLNEDIRMTEIREMAHNFNLMTKELAATELFRNDFIENVSHEFKTPLTAIEGYATLLQRPGIEEQKRAEYTEKILLNTRRLSTMTGNILLLSRLENQQLEVKKELFSLDEQLREVILLLESQWNAKDLELDIDLESVDYCGNPELLDQVWQNIIGNAVKFTPPGALVRVLLRREGDAVRVDITDTGPGMSEEVRERVFEKFYQGDPSRHGQGNGLGLALAKRIVDLHGGSIQVASVEGQGAHFTVLLPEKAAEPAHDLGYRGTAHEFATFISIYEKAGPRIRVGQPLLYHRPGLAGA